MSALEYLQKQRVESSKEAAQGLSHRETKTSTKGTDNLLRSKLNVQDVNESSVYTVSPVIPIVAVYSAMSPFHRVQWVLLLAGAALASFYQYKEMIEESKRSLTYSTFRKLAGGVLFSTLLFVWLLRFYFISS